MSRSRNTFRTGSFVLTGLLAVLVTVAPWPAHGAFEAGNSTVGTTAYPNGGLARIGALRVSPDANDTTCAVIDPAAGNAYFGTDWPAMVVKVALGSGPAAPTQVGTLALDTGDGSANCAVIDAAAGYAYFGTNTSPGTVVKVALGSGAAPPTRVGALTLDPGENQLSCAVIDAAAGYAYFGTSTIPSYVVKVALGSGPTPPTRVGALTLPEAQLGLTCAVIDPASGYAYFATAGSGLIGGGPQPPATVSKLALGGAGLPQDAGWCSFNNSEYGVCTAVIDPAAGYAYFGSLSPGMIKVALGSGSAPPTRVSSLVITTPPPQPGNGVIDPAAGFVYLGEGFDYNFPGTMYKVATGSGTAAPTQVGVLTLNTWECHIGSAVIDAAAGYAYFGASAGSPLCNVVKASLSENGAIKATMMTMPDLGYIADVRFYTHVAIGNVRLAIYDNSAPKRLLWQSASIPNSVAGGFIVAPISSGTPNSLQLSAGTYWLGWQVDTNADVPSYTAGTVGDGFCLAQPYGAFPATGTGETSTAEKWTEYVTYTVSTTTTVASSLNPSKYGQEVTLTATVSGASSTGQVIFMDGSTTLGARWINNGTATFTTAVLAVGSHSITAVYGGDADYAGSTSAPITQTVKWSQSIAFNPLPAIVSDAPDFSPGATASSGLLVSYTSSNAAVATIVGGMIRLVGPGTTTITASQDGDGNFAPATDVQQTLTVIPATPLEVFVRFTIAGNVSVAWGNGTWDGSRWRTAGDITPIDWVVKDDVQDGRLGVGETCMSNDDNNLLTIIVENTTNTATNAKVSATVASSGGWSIGGAPAADTFEIQAQLGRSPWVTLAAAAQELTSAAKLAKGDDQALVLTVLTPTAITRNVGVEKVMFVVLTATPE